MIIKPTGETIYKEAGVDREKLICHRCNNRTRKMFYTFESAVTAEDVTYCLNCINLGRVDSATPLRAVETVRFIEPCDYHLDFELSDVQKQASSRIVEAVHLKQHILLHAVTGAGKTEMTFEGIKTARNQGKNVAFVSPRIDVVKEVYLRLTGAFKDVRIDLMYAGVKVEFEHTFTVCTVHQLYNHVSHFDVIIVDEYDAFPLQGEPLLLGAIDRAMTEDGMVVIMTATPTRAMMNYVGKKNMVTIARRYHGHDLAVPEVIYDSVSRHLDRGRVSRKLFELLTQIVQEGRRVLVFLPEIAMMKKLAPLVKQHFNNSDDVYSGDADRYLKVEHMRKGETDILLTTTILERGVTFSKLDVIVVHAEYFPSDSLIQICGRVGRKTTDPSGNIYFLADYNTHHLKRTVKIIRDFNQGRVGL